MFVRKIKTTIQHKKMNIQGWFCKHPILLLTLLMFTTSLVVFYSFLFGDKVFIFSDIGSDTQNVYYPFFVSLERHIKTGNFSLWGFDYGMGTNFLARQSDIGNPFTYLTFILGSTGIEELLIVVHILKIFIAGYLCYYYLGNFSFTELSKVITAYIYAFNGFLMLWGQHYFFGNAVLYIVLMLWAIETAIGSKKQYFLLIFSSFMVMCNNYYLAYMILLFSAFYTLIRLFFIYSLRELKVAIKKGFIAITAVLTGTCLAAFIFIPSVSLLVKTSSRLEQDKEWWTNIVNNLTSYYDMTTLKSIISRIYSNNLMGTTEYKGVINYYESPQWFFSSFTFFILFIFVFELLLDKKENVKTKIIKSLSVVVVLVSVLHPFLSFVLNGFIAPFFRFTYLVMPLVGLCYASVLDKVIGHKLIFPKTEIIFSGVMSLLVFVCNIYSCHKDNSLNVQLAKLYFMMLVIFVAVTMFIQLTKRKELLQKVLVLGVGVLVMMNVTVDSYIVNNQRDSISAQHLETWKNSKNKTVQKILSELKKEDQSFYRIEKTFQDISYLNDSMVQGYYGVSTYNSVINKHLIRFKNEICPEFQVTDMEGYQDFKQIMNRVDVVSTLGVKYILSQEYITQIPEYQYLRTVDNIHVYRNTSTEGVAKFFDNAMDYETFCQLDDSEKKNILNRHLIVHDMGEEEDDLKAQSSSQVVLQKPKKDNHIEGQVTAQNDGWAFFAIPFEDGWKAYVDGKEIPIHQANIGFTAIKVTQGMHEIVLRYETPYLKTGIMISAFGVASLFMWCICLYKAHKDIQKDEKAYDGRRCLQDYDKMIQ